MKTLFNNKYFAITFIPGLVFGIVIDEGIVYIVFACIDIEIKTFNFFRKRKNKFGRFKK